MGILKQTKNEIYRFSGFGSPMDVEWIESAGELKQRFLKEENIERKKKLHALWLIRDGHSHREVSQFLDLDQQKLSRWLSEYRVGGLSKVLNSGSIGNTFQNLENPADAGSDNWSKEHVDDVFKPNQVYSDVVSFLRVIITNLWLIVLVFAVGMGITYYAVRQQPRIFESQATMIVSPRVNSDGSADILRSIDVMNFDVIGTYIQLLRSQTSFQNVIETLPGDFNKQDIQDAIIEVRPIENSAVIVIKTRSQSPALAYTIARDLPKQVSSDIVPESLVNLYPIQVLDPAVIPQNPVSPNIRLSYLLGGVGSLILGVGLAFVWYSIKHSQKDLVD